MLDPSHIWPEMYNINNISKLFKSLFLIKTKENCFHLFNLDGVLRALMHTAIIFLTERKFVQLDISVMA